MMHRTWWMLVAASVCAAVAVGGSWLFLTKPLAAAAPAAPAAMADQPVTILEGKETFYRWMSVQRPAVIVAEAGAAERTTLTGKKIDAEVAAQVKPGLPAGWTDGAFEDATWPRTTVSRLANLAYLVGDGLGDGAVAMLSVGVIAARGKFNVTDPAAQLKLSLKYRGGVVVYLNGQEIARGGLPADAITPGTPGDPYPDSAYVDAGGKLLPMVGRTKDKDIIDRITSRDRLLGPVAIPAKAVRKGLNVLAIEVHRSDYGPAATKWGKAFLDYRNHDCDVSWTPCALMDLRLSADGGGVESNANRPSGVQVWNQDCNDRSSAMDYGDPNEPLKPIVLAGARNGVFAGKVMVSSDQPIEGLKAVASELKATGGKGGTIAASAIDVRYSSPLIQDTEWAEPLMVVPPAKVAVAKKGGAVVPVWVLVKVPADAPAGDYAGMLAISVGEKKLADVSVNLHVADWTLPKPADFQTFVGIYQSPTTLAMRYKVAEWSDKHWELMDRSMVLLGQLGNQLVHVTVVDKTKFGNDDGMVTWIKKPDGTFDYDYSIIERYLKLVHKHLGVPKFVVLNIYQAGGWTPAGPKQENTVTVLDKATGERSHLQVPEFGTEESKKFWEPVLLGLKDRLAKEGMEKSLCLGSLCEPYPTAAEEKVFVDILGKDVQWFRQGHPGHGSLNSAEDITGGGHVGLHFFTYLPGMPDPEAGVPTLHKVFWPRAAYFRHITDTAKPLPCLRSFAAHARFLQLPGFGYLGLDYWQTPGVANASEHGGATVWGRWPRASNYPGALSPQFTTWAGPDGAEPMTIFQALREGLQETEALCLISEAQEKSADKLGAELASRCRQALKDQLTYYIERRVGRWQHTYYQINHYGWQELSQRVYTLAGEVAAKTGSK